MIFHDVEQNTDLWLELRIGKITGSALQKVMANYGKAFGEPAKKYAIQIALERITGKRQVGGYSNAHTERGHEQEPLARMLYEDTYFCDVSNGGFFDLGNVGCSPDGLVGNDGEIEIKCVIDHVHYANKKRNNLDPAYKWQFYSNLKFTGREWIDFVSYCADYPVGKQLFTYRLHAKDCAEQFAMIDSRLVEFEQHVNTVTNDILS